MLFTLLDSAFFEAKRALIDLIIRQFRYMNQSPHWQ